MRFEGERALWDWSELVARFGPAIDRFEPDLVAGGALDAGRLSFSFTSWARLGAPPVEAESEALDTWAVMQETLFDALVGKQQHVDVRSVGFVGAAGATLQVVVDRHDLSTMDRFVDSAQQPLPAPPVAHALVVAREPAMDRPAQLARWARLARQLDLIRRFLPIRVRVDVDAHLEHLSVRTPDRFSLGWVSGRRDGIASLEIAEVGPDGSRQPINLANFDANSGVVTVSAAESVLLPDSVAAVARQARTRQGKLVRHVADEMGDPTKVIPEGLDVDAFIDLSEYASRVIGFERYQGKQRPLIHDPSNTDWHAPADDGAFLRLPFRKPDDHSPTLIAVHTGDDARGLLSSLEGALARGSADPPAVTFDGHLIAATEQLRDTVARAIRLSDERKAHEDDPRPIVPKRAPLAAVIAGLEASDVVDDDGPQIDESTVPLSRLAALLAPGVELKAHQRRGIAWMWHHAQRGEPGLLLADDMGLGKTLQVSAYLALRYAERDTSDGRDGPTLIVAPTVLLDNWQGEFSRFFQPRVFDPICVLHGDNLRRLRRGTGLDLDEITRARVVLTNYETVGAHQTSLLKVPFSVVVFDEVQALKNETTLRSRGAQGLKREMAIGMTGTPVENRLSDLWALFESLQQRSDRRAFGGRSDFERTYERAGPEGIAKVRDRLRFPTASSIVLRREKAQALRDLPPKQFHEVAIEMTPYQLELERVIVREMRSKGPFGVLDKLRKLYQHPALVTQQDRLRLDPATALRESPKTARVVALLKDIRQRQQKAIVFTQWVSMQELLRELFLRELGLRRVNIINGDPLRRAVAQRVIQDFTQSPGFDVLILSPLAAGVGLTITAATHVIHYGRWWNPAKEDQATDRAHRIGQTQVVHVYYPLLHHPGNPNAGFDVKLHRLVEAKRSVARDFLAPAEDQGLERELEAALRSNSSP